MRYVLTIYEDETWWATQSPEETGKMMAGYQAFGEAAQAAGVMAGGEGLQPTRTATTVRVRNGGRLVTDGPFAETTEQLGGFYILDCKDLDEAIEWASKIPGAEKGSVEVRPVMDYEAMRALQGQGAATA
jgi:hypothetical protein